MSESHQPCPLRVRPCVWVLVLVLVGTLAGLSAPRAQASEPASSQGLHVIPFPGTPDASSLSNIIFSSLEPSQITSVLVSGSMSGPHTGHLTGLPDGAGSAFVPDAPFKAGEQVHVTASLTSSQAGTASGDPGANTLRFSFTVAVPAGAPPGAASPARAPRPAAGQTATASPETMHFYSQPGLHPPRIKHSDNPDQHSGDIFLTPRVRQGPFQQGPMILNARGQLVWFDPVGAAGATTLHALNLQVQRYQGQPVLTWWEGYGIGRGGRARDVIMNRRYQTVAVVRAGDGYFAGVHEFQITPQGTALLETAVPVRANLISVGGSATGSVWDFIIQELDIKTGVVLWEWHALGHVPLSASHLRPAGVYDYFHLNSIQQLPDGNLLVSARNTWAVYEIDKQTGKIIWTVGGRRSNFRVGPGANFSWQHDARLTGSTLTLFDDALIGAPTDRHQSSAIILRLNFGARTATLVHRYNHHPPLSASSQGSTQILPNGNVFVGWGNQPDFSESRPDGRQIFNGSLPFGVISYRAYRFSWTGHPAGGPSLALVAAGGGKLRVYASWNGATSVSAWRVLGGSSPQDLRGLGRSRRTGFETEIKIASQPGYVAVQALARSGAVLGTSPVRADPPNSPR